VENQIPNMGILSFSKECQLGFSPTMKIQSSTTKFICVASCSDGTGIMSLLLEVIICLFIEIHEIKGIFWVCYKKKLKYFHNSIVNTLFTLK